MKARLYIVQHGDAVSKEIDTDRPLSDKGVLDVGRVAEHMAKKDVLVQRIVHSGKLRAEQTAKVFAEMLAPDVAPEVIPGINPNDDPAEFIKTLEDIEGTMLIVSHMPFVSNLCSYLVCGKSDASFGFTPGSIVCVSQDNGQWYLHCMVNPDLL